MKIGFSDGNWRSLFCEAIVSLVNWVRANLFRNWFDGLVSLVLIALLAWAAFAVFEWAVLHAVWNAESLIQCNQLVRERHGTDAGGACWAVLKERSLQLAFGFYPEHLYLRPVLAIGLLPLALAPIVFRPWRRWVLWFAICYPIVSYFLVFGGFGMEKVPSARIGGFLLVFVFGVFGSVIAIAGGIAIALIGLFGILPVRLIMGAFHAVFSRIPIFILFYAGFVGLSYVLPLGLVLDFPFLFDLIFRIVLVLGLVSAAQIAETLRNDLATSLDTHSIGAAALGFTPTKSFWVVLFPAAFRQAFPKIVDELADLSRNTAIVSMIGLLDPLGLINNIRADSAWNGVVVELFISVAICFWVISFTLTSYSRYLRRCQTWETTRVQETYA